MKITAKAANQENAVAKKLKSMQLTDKNITVRDGEIRITTRVEFAEGPLRLAISLTTAEVMQLAARALTGPLEARVASLETKAAEIPAH